MTTVTGRILLGVLALLGTLGGALASEHRVALVVGNATYRSAIAPAAGRNAAVVADSLRAAGFEVTHATDLTRSGLEEALRRLSERARRGDVALFYYSGLTVSTGGRGYLLPVDARLASEFDAAPESVAVDRALTALDARGAAVIDPIVPNPLVEKLSGISGGAAAVKAALDAPAAAPGVLVAYSHQPGTPPALVGGSGAGPYADTLARAAVTAGTDVRAALAAAGQAVAERSGGRQTAWQRDDLRSAIALGRAAPPPRPEAPSRVEPLVAVAPPPEPPPTLPPGPYTVNRATTLFAQPVLGAQGVAALPPGAAVTLAEAVTGSNWVRVRDQEGREGFLSAAALTPAALTPPALDPTLGPGAGNSGPPPTPPSGGGSAAAAPAVSAPGAVPLQPALDTARAAATRADSQAAAARAAAERARSAGTRALAAAESARAEGNSRGWAHRYPNGDVYEGENGGNGARNGVGVYRFIDGQVYAGEWSNGLADGVGVVTFASGERFEGTVRGGQPDGVGVFHFPNGSAYAGEVARGRVLGLGELRYGNGDRYVGGVVDRLPAGDGELRGNSGSRHLGRFSRGRPDGPGVATAVDGTRRVGLWRGSVLLPE